jgi:hypothetical protein
MSAEFHIVFDDLAWYKKNQPTVKRFIQALATFEKKASDQEYWLKGDEAGGDWAYGARIFIRAQDILLEISSHPRSIVNDIRNLYAFIHKNTNAKVVDEDGDIINDYMHIDS